MIVNKKIIFAIFVIISVTSCKGQNKKKPDNMEIKEIALFRKVLNQNNYNLEDEKSFENMNTEYLGIKPNNTNNKSYDNIKIQNEFIDYQISNDGKFIKIGQDILPDLDELINENNMKTLNTSYFKDIVNMNKLLYLNDVSTIPYFISKKSDLGIDILVLFNYEKNNFLFQSATKNIKKLDDYDNVFRASLLWYNNKNKTEIIRKKLISELENKNPALIYSLTQWLFDNKEIKKYTNQSLIDKTWAYLVNLQLEKNKKIDFTNENKGYQLVNNNYQKDEKLLERLKKENFYGYPFLNDATQAYLTQSIENDLDYGIIQDKDGYTNLRKEKNTTSEIIQKINTGEKVEILESRDANWYYVKTKNGNEGYVNRSRLKFE